MFEFHQFSRSSAGLPVQRKDHNKPEDTPWNSDSMMHKKIFFIDFPPAG
jgi:hypothetical protein